MIQLALAVNLTQSKIPVALNYNYMITNNVIRKDDYLDCKMRTLKTSKYILSDVNGTPFTLNRGSENPTIMFHQMGTRS